MLDNEKFAFVAGIVEGEGTFSLSRSIDQKQGKHYTSFHPQIIIVNNNLQLLEFCQDVVGGTIYEKQEPKGSYPFHGKVFDLRIFGQRKVLDAIANLLPFLVSKKREAELLYEYCQSRINSPAKQPYTQREKEIYRVLCGMHNKGRALHRS